MTETQETIIRELGQRRLPPWEALPDLALYMDQVLNLVGRYLPGSGEDKVLTAAMVNNYVKHKVLLPPVNKRYSRSHIVALLMICTLKSVMPLSAIQQLLQSAGGAEGIPALYSDFREIYAYANQSVSAQALKAGQSGPREFLHAALGSQAAQTLATALLPTLAHS